MNFRRSIIYNHCRVMAAWSRKELNIFEKFLRFLEKRPITVKIFKILLRKFSSRHRLACCAQISWNLADGNGWNHALLTSQKNKISPGCPAVVTAHIAPKICQSQPPTMYSECSRFYPNRFNFGGVIGERKLSSSPSTVFACGSMFSVRRTAIGREVAEHVMKTPL